MKYPILSSVFALVASQAFLTPVSAAAKTPAGGSYTVKSGDTFAKIARARGISLGELLKANRISNPDRITKGQQIVIPGSSKAATPVKSTAAAKPAAKKPTVSKPEAPKTVKTVKTPPTAPKRAADSATTVNVTPPAPQGICVVQSGDTLYRIQRRTGVSVPTLIKLNGLTETSTLRPGQSLRISTTARTTTKPNSTGRPAADTQVARQSGQPTIIDQNQTRDPAGTEPVTPPATGTAPHKVGSGETFSSISRVYGISSTQLAAANRGVNPARLRAGQTLMIPGQPVRTQPKPLIVRADGRVLANRPDPLGEAPTDEEMPSGRTRTGYLVEEGENIQQIAQRFHTTEGVIRRMNRLGESDNVYAGRYILVPFIRQAPAQVPVESRGSRRSNA